MIARVAKALNEKEKGFTLIELLVVIIIIGILSAIAIPVFMNQRQKAVDSGIKSDIRTIATTVETFYVDEQEYPAGFQAQAEVVIGETTVYFSDDASTYTLEVTDQTYTISGVNTEKGTGTTFNYDSAQGGFVDSDAPAGN